MRHFDIRHQQFDTQQNSPFTYRRCQLKQKSCHPSSKFMLQTLWSLQPDCLKMDEVSLRLIIPDSKLWLHSRECARFYRKINCIPSAAIHGACTKIFWNLINCTNFYGAEISWLLRLNVVMNKWMREWVRKGKYYRQEEHDSELYRNILISERWFNCQFSITVLNSNRFGQPKNEVQTRLTCD
jgi:hypothetical protein